MKVPPAVSSSDTVSDALAYGVGEVQQRDVWGRRVAQRREWALATPFAACARSGHRPADAGQQLVPSRAEPCTAGECRRSPGHCGRTADRRPDRIALVMAHAQPVVGHYARARFTQRAVEYELQHTLARRRDALERPPLPARVGMARVRASRRLASGGARARSRRSTAPRRSRARRCRSRRHRRSSLPRDRRRGRSGRSTTSCRPARSDPR